MAQKLWDVWRGNCGTWRRNYGILHVCSLRRGVVVLSVPGALAGLLAAVGASRAVVGL